MTKSNYEDRKQRRIERYHELAERNREKASQLIDESCAAVAQIPPGQPILIGHHSERGHRKDLERSDNKMRQAAEAKKKADYYEDKAAAAEANRAISADDPEAINKLKEKIEQAETRQTRMKAVNAAHRKYLKDPATLDKADLTDTEKKIIREYEPRNSWEHPFAPYELSNNNANIRRMKRRLAGLEKAKSRETREYVIEGVTVIENTEENRLQLFFDSKPPEETRKRLKSNGFRWARSIGAWQRQLNTLGNNARNFAEQAIGKEG